MNSNNMNNGMNILQESPSSFLLQKNSTPTPPIPTHASLETISLYCLFVVSFLYFWLATYAFRQIYHMICKRNKDNTTVEKVARQRYLATQAATAFHAIIRFFLLILAYFTDASNTLSSTLNLRRAVLGDLPGFIFVGIYLNILNTMHGKFSNYFTFTANSNPSTPLLSTPPNAMSNLTDSSHQQNYNTAASSTSSSTPSSYNNNNNNLMEKTFGPMVIGAKKIKRRLKPTMQDNEVLRSSLVFIYAACILCWLILIVFLSTNNEPDADIMELNTIRDSLFFGLFLIVFLLSVIGLYRLKYLDDDAFIARQFGFSSSSLYILNITILVTFLARLSAVSSVIFFSSSNDPSKDEAGRPVLILPNTSLTDLIFSVIYYIVCEIICGNVCVHIFRNRLFTSDHDQTLERGLLPSDLEISPNEISDLDAIGSGGYGVVYRAMFRSMPIAVKKFHPKLGNNTVPLDVVTEQRRRFVQEAKILCSLRSPRVVQMLGYTYFQQEKSFALIMEYVKQGSLFKLLHGTNVPLNVGGAVKCAERIAEGLIFLHASGIIHRDLKSGNILIDEYFSPKICDFGLSKQFEYADSFSSQPSAHGTVSWSAPELLLGRECTTKVDVYSFAFIMWELLARAIPHRRKPNAEVIFGVLGRKQLRPPLPALFDPKRDIQNDDNKDNSGIDNSNNENEQLSPLTRETNEILKLQEIKKSEDDLMQILTSAWAPEPLKRQSSTLILNQLQTWQKQAPRELLKIDIKRKELEASPLPNRKIGRDLWSSGKKKRQQKEKNNDDQNGGDDDKDVKKRLF